MDEVEAVGNRLIAALGGNIEKEEKEFHAHVTLGRIKQKPPKDTISQLVMQYENMVFGESDVASLVLFQSVLTPTGPIYTPLGEAPLLKTV
jgi:2'-5' RNA ligase